MNEIRFLDPLFFGQYPNSMQKLVGSRLPEISPEISKLLKKSLDFVGINHYTTLYARNDRTRFRKFVLQDASTDSAVITSRKKSDRPLQKLFIMMLTLSTISSLIHHVLSFLVAAYRFGVPIGERVIALHISYKYTTLFS